MMNHTEHLHPNGESHHSDPHHGTLIHSTLQSVPTIVLEQGATNHEIAD